MADAAGAPSASRIASIVDPVFASGLSELTVKEIRRRRDEALAEREFLSYLRRLIQVRHSILMAERDRRASGAEPEPLVERLTTVLSDGPKGGRGRGEALRVSVSDADVEEARHQLESLLGESAMAHPEDLGQDQLEETLDSLTEAERRVSADRGAVLRVHDRLQDELKQRYREDLGQIPRDL